MEFSECDLDMSIEMSDIRNQQTEIASFLAMTLRPFVIASEERARQSHHQITPSSNYQIA